MITEQDSDEVLGLISKRGPTTVDEFQELLHWSNWKVNHVLVQLRLSGRIVLEKVRDKRKTLNKYSLKAG